MNRLLFCFFFLFSLLQGVHCEIRGLNNDYYFELNRGVSGDSGLEVEFNIPMSSDSEKIFPKRGTGFTVSGFFMLNTDANGDIFTVYKDSNFESIISMSYINSSDDGKIQLKGKNFYKSVKYFQPIHFLTNQRCNSSLPLLFPRG